MMSHDAFNDSFGVISTYASTGIPSARTAVPYVGSHQAFEVPSFRACYLANTLVAVAT